MLVATSTLKYENARKPLMALILTFSQREKGLEGIPIFIPMTCSGGVFHTNDSFAPETATDPIFQSNWSDVPIADKNASIAAASSWGLW